MKKNLLVVLGLMVLVFCGCSRNNEPTTPVVEGQKAPDFTLKNLAGDKVRLADLKGKVVLVNFWASWCPPCREEIPSMVRLNGLMAGKPFQMLAISIDEGGKEAVENYFRKSGTTLPALLDPKREIGKMYGITGVPETFVLDKNGVILKKIVGGMDWSDPGVVNYLDGVMSH